MTHSQKKRIGLLGGSFNPAHEGHVYISEKALELLGLDEVWWILSPHNPLKSAAELWPLAKRTKSAKKLLHNKTNIKLSHIETEKGFRRIFDTITHLQAQYPQNHFVWLMGADNLASFHNWHRWQDIANSIPIAVLDRDFEGKNTQIGQNSLRNTEFSAYELPASHAASLADSTPPAWVFLPIPTHPASATFIRKSLEKPEKP